MNWKECLFQCNNPGLNGETENHGKPRSGQQASGPRFEHGTYRNVEAVIPAH